MQAQSRMLQIRELGAAFGPREFGTVRKEKNEREKFELAKFEQCVHSLHIKAFKNLEDC